MKSRFTTEKKSVSNPPTNMSSKERESKAEMEEVQLPRTVGEYGSNATEAQAHEIQQKLTNLLDPILNDLSIALQHEIDQKVKAAKKKTQRKEMDRS